MEPTVGKLTVGTIFEELQQIVIAAEPDTTRSRLRAGERVNVSVSVRADSVGLETEVLVLLHQLRVSVVTEDLVSSAPQFTECLRNAVVAHFLLPQAQSLAVVIITLEFLKVKLVLVGLLNNSLTLFNPLSRLKYKRVSTLQWRTTENKSFLRGS
jgi:hypothetical protein